MKETTVAFKDGNDLKLRDKDGRLFSRRAALAGAAGALAFAGTCLYSFVNRVLRAISA